MKTATIKDTKQIIFEAYEEAVAQLREARSAKFDPATEKVAKQKQEVSVKAKAIVEMNILNGDIVDKYNALNEAIASKEEDLNEYYNIEKEIDSLLALVESKKVIQLKMEAEYAKKLEELEDKVDEVKLRYNKAAEDLGVERTREMEQYKYDLKRSRQIENNNWADEKTARENVLAAKEAEHEQEVKALELREVNLETLESKVAEIPTLIAQAAQEASIKAKKDAETSHAIEKNVIKRETQLDKTLLENKVATLEANVSRLERENESLMAKLEAAQSRVETIATTAVNAAQPRVISNEK